MTTPVNIAGLPVNKAGYPIPWFVDRKADKADGQPDFRYMDARKLADAIRFDLCWVCGKIRGRFGTFVVGPMCAVNRTSAEPPCHLACAIYSATHCPFLITPRMHRRDMPPGAIEAAGVMLKRNPGVALAYTSRSFSHYKAPGGVLFDLGEPHGDLQWFCEGRPATAGEILVSLNSGLPALMEVAEAEGRSAVDELRARYDLVAGSLA